MVIAAFAALEKESEEFQRETLSVSRCSDDKHLLLAGFQVRSLIMLTVITGPSMDKDGRDITTLSWLAIHGDLGSD